LSKCSDFEAAGRDKSFWEITNGIGVRTLLRLLEHSLRQKAAMDASTRWPGTIGACKITYRVLFGRPTPPSTHAGRRPPSASQTSTRVDIARGYRVDIRWKLPRSARGTSWGCGATRSRFGRSRLHSATRSREPMGGSRPAASRLAARGGRRGRVPCAGARTFIWCRRKNGERWA